MFALLFFFCFWMWWMSQKLCITVTKIWKNENRFKKRCEKWKKKTKRIFFCVSDLVKMKKMQILQNYSYFMFIHKGESFIIVLLVWQKYNNWQWWHWQFIHKVCQKLENFFTPRTRKIESEKRIILQKESRFKELMTKSGFCEKLMTLKKKNINLNYWNQHNTWY